MATSTVWGHALLLRVPRGIEIRQHTTLLEEVNTPSFFQIREVLGSFIVPLVISGQAWKIGLDPVIVYFSDDLVKVPRRPPVAPIILNGMAFQYS